MRQIGVTILLFVCFSLYSNDTITRKNDSIAYKNYTSVSFSPIQVEDSWIVLNDIWNLQLEYNRYITNFLSIGGYVGVGMFDEWIVDEDENSIGYTFTRYRYSAHYGLNSKLHIIPLFSVTYKPRFDLYVTGNLGGISMFTSLDDNISPERGHYFDYSLMGGGSVFISKRLAVFIEAGYRQFKYHNGFNAKYGLTIRF